MAFDNSGSRIRSRAARKLGGPPANVSAPVISGTPISGHTLTCTPGVYANAASVTRIWFYVNGDGGAGVSGGTETGLTLVLTDVNIPDTGDTFIYCEETAVGQGSHSGDQIITDSNQLGPFTLT